MTAQTSYLNFHKTFMNKVHTQNDKQFISKFQVKEKFIPIYYFTSTIMNNILISKNAKQLQFDDFFQPIDCQASMNLEEQKVIHRFQNLVKIVDLYDDYGKHDLHWIDQGRTVFKDPEAHKKFETSNISFGFHIKWELRKTTDGISTYRYDIICNDYPGKNIKSIQDESKLNNTETLTLEMDTDIRSKCNQYFEKVAHNFEQATVRINSTINFGKLKTIIKHEENHPMYKDSRAVDLFVGIKKNFDRELNALTSSTNSLKVINKIANKRKTSQDNSEKVDQITEKLSEIQLQTEAGSKRSKNDDNNNVHDSLKYPAKSVSKSESTIEKHPLPLSGKARNSRSVPTQMTTKEEEEKSSTTSFEKEIPDPHSNRIEPNSKGSSKSELKSITNQTRSDLDEKSTFLSSQINSKTNGVEDQNTIQQTDENEVIEEELSSESTIVPDEYGAYRSQLREDSTTTVEDSVDLSELGPFTELGSPENSSVNTLTIGKESMESLSDYRVAVYSLPKRNEL